MTAYLPEIDGLLPVYVEDRYSGFEVKAFSRLSGRELRRYLELNVAAVRDVVERAGGVDAALANHLVMGPVILARAGVRFVAKIHGSALSYTVRPDPERFLPFAREGLDAATVRSSLAVWDAWWGDVLLVAAGQESLAAETERLDTLRSHAAQYGVAGAVTALNAVADARRHLEEHASPTLALEVMLLELPRAGARAGS